MGGGSMSAPHFVAFYSYRGGVGRTSALCNVAARMIMQGDRVLVIDMDLQAPGVSIFLGGGNPSGSEGLVEEMNRTAEDVPNLRRLVRPMKLGSRPFWLMPSGKLDGTYPERAEQVEPRTADHTERLMGFFQRLRRAIEEAPQRFHYVLVDCRPGLTTIGVTAVSILADTVVLLFGLNRQSLSGVTWAHKKFYALNKLIHLVASPVPAREDVSEALREAESAWHEMIPVKLRFEESFLMNERLLLPPDNRPLSADYDALTRIVRTPDDVYSLIQDGNQKLSQAGQGSEALKRFREAVNKDPQDPRALVALANFYAVQNRHPLALEQLEKVLEADRGNPEAWQVIDQIGEALKGQSDAALAQRLEAVYEKAPAGIAAKNHRVALALFSARVRAITRLEGEDRRLAAVEALQEAAQAAQTDQNLWNEFARRLPIAATPKEERDDLAEWVRLSKPVAAQLSAFLEARLVERCTDVAGTVSRFGFKGFGFITSDDGEESLYFERSDCEGYGEDENDFVAVGDSAVFDLVPSDKGRGWRATRVRFPSREADTW